MSLRSPRTLIFVALIALTTVVPRSAEFYTDWLWFKEVGFEQVFLRSLTASTTVTAATGLVVFAILWANLAVVFRSLRPRHFTIVTTAGPQVISMDPRRYRPLVVLVAGIAALLIALYAGSRWETWLYFIYGTPFGKTDPILGRDIGFYVFTLPLLEMVNGTLLGTLVLASAVTVGAYVFAGEVGLDPDRGPYASAVAVRHVSTLATALLIVLAFGAWLQIPQLLTTPSGVVAGASYADVHARMPALRVLIVAALAGAAVTIWQGMVAGRLRALGIAAALYLVVLFGGSGYAAIIQRFVVAPNEQVRETPFIVHNIKATRDAFALDRVEERGLSGDARLTRADLERNAATIENVPLWNERPLLDTFSQLQEIRTYYDFASVDNDRYTINGKYRQIMLSARELNSASLPSRTWINEHLTFTHGYGLTLGPVNEVAAEGLPVLFIRDLPLVSTVDLKVTQPAIYYGELPNDHVFVNTRTEEFDYPRGEDNVFAAYKGRGGVPLSNVFRRLMFAIRFRSTDTFFSPNLTTESRVMMHRRIADRVRRIAPFLTYDRDPYLAISEGRLVWMQDVYLTSSRYPYSTSAGGVNYIRNAVKITIDAYHGTTTFHLLDPSDPIAATDRPDVPGIAPADRDDAGRPAVAAALSARNLLAPGRHVRDVPHAEPRGVLQPRGPMGNPVVRDRRPDRAHVALLHGHEAAGREGAGVHPDAPVHAAAEGQPRRVDGGAQRRRSVRAPRRVPVPEADGHLRAEADRRAHQPGPGHRAADHAVEPAGVRSDPGDAAGHPDRGVADLHPSAVSARRRRLDSGAQARDRRVSESNRHGGDARTRARSALPGTDTPRRLRRHRRSKRPSPAARRRR